MRRMIIRPLSLLLLIISATFVYTQSQYPIVFSGVTVIDATGSPAKPNMTVVVEGDRITQIGPRNKVKIPAGAQSVHEELELLVNEIGMTPMGALQSATRNPAVFFGLGESLGTIEKGKIADLVLLDANPLESIGNTKKIDSVVIRGKLFTRSGLQRVLAAAEDAARK